MSDARRITDQFFFANTGMDPDVVTQIVTKALAKSDGGELYLQRVMSKGAQFSDGRLEANGSSLDQGFGFRRISGESIGYAHSQDLSEAKIESFSRSTRRIQTATKNKVRYLQSPTGIVIPGMYDVDNPLDNMTDAARIQLLEAVDARARAADPRIIQVTAGIATVWSVVTIIRRDGQRFDDVRPMSQLVVNVIAQEGNRRKAGSSSLSTRRDLTEMFAQHSWESCVDNAVRKAQVNFSAVPAPAGEMPVVLANGWAGVMLHESVGHGLEGDAARKDSSVYAGKVGQRIASPGVTIVDQGNIFGVRGSLSFDDEGIPTQRNILIEDGILRGFMQDQISARYMGVAPTGNCRRESYADVPLVRMTNTYMENGVLSPEEIIESVDFGIMGVDFNGGQVETASGDFVFAPSEAYLIKNGKIVAPIEDAVLIGNGPRSMSMVDMVGNNSQLSLTGNCGKDGQTVAVTVGQPTCKMRGIKVGGTQPS